ADDPFAVLTRHAGLAGQVVADLGQHALAQRQRVEVDVEHLRPELADDGEVDAGLDVGERVGAGAGGEGRSRRGKALGEVHQALLRRRRPRRRPRSADRSPSTIAASFPYARAPSERGLPSTSARPSLSSRGMSRSLGTITSGAAPSTTWTSS